jgi:hypothetical protein
LHHAVQKDALIPYERSFLSQADLKKAFGSTFYERKQMSTKTTIKRVALVAVSALGFGLLSVAPSQAAAKYVSPITLTAPTTPVVGTAAATTVKVGAPVLANTDTISVKGYFTARPAATSNLLYNDQTADAGNLNYAADVAVGDAVPVIELSVAATGAVAASTITLGTINFVPTVAGSYTLKVWNDQDGGGTISVGEDTAEVTFTVAAANTTPSATYSTIEAWSVDVPSASKAAGTALGGADASINITVKNTADAALDEQTIRAVVKGPGRVSLGGGAAGRDVTETLGDGVSTTTLAVTADGSAGSMTVDVYAGTTLLGTTDAVIWYGTLATLTATQAKTVVGKNAAAADAVTVVGKDADGVAVPLTAAGLVGTSSDTTVIATYAAADGTLEDDGSLTVAINGANDLTTTSGRTATMTFKYLISGTTYATASALTFTIGGALKTVTATFDKASYAPGEKVTVTFSAKDASGNAAADGDIFAAGKLTTTIASQGLTTAAVASVGGTKTTTFYAPAVSGSFSLVGTTTVALATAAVLATATVVNPAETAAEAAADAAAEAIDAANAATDAANLAAEAADAATVAAEEARDAADAATAAVEELATQVATLMAALKAQITTLANTVAKIAKKVKA